MQSCPSCNRPLLRPGACPFCGATVQTTPGLPRALTAGVAALVLSACYGPPPSGIDNPSCDDPQVEVCDDAIDNDCDGDTDAGDTDCPAG
jgi:hypothetical protein